MRYLLLILLLMGCSKPKDQSLLEYDLIKVVKCGLPLAFDDERAEEYWHCLTTNYYRDQEDKDWMYGYQRYQMGIEE